MVKFTPALSLVVWLASLGATHAQEMTKPLGKWERKTGKSHVTLIVEDNRLHAISIGEMPCTLHADYCTTKDGVIYGVITSIEYDEDDDYAKAIFDAPFSCRYRIDEGTLIIRELRCQGVNNNDVWSGRFKAIAPAPPRTNAVAPSPPAYLNNTSLITPSTPAAEQFWWGFSR